jgi:hypothetical protein
VSIGWLSGGNAGAGLSGGSTTDVLVTFDFQTSSTVFTYTVQDALGATDTGTLTLLTTLCGGGGINEP